MSGVRLGYALGSGEPVEIPVRHMVVTGQTQEAGKTTTLEALIERAGLSAVTFVTKRGEGAFKGARRIEPYFREQADWQFVAAILEASRGEKMKFERSWIIKASKGAHTLADVHRNVRKQLLTAKGISEGVYTVLDAYLDVVVPAIAAVRWAPKVDLTPGVNAMDLTALPHELQHLVIKSTLDWVLAHAEHTVVVVPEAWKFIPQGRGSPVKLSAESYIRQAAGLGNYLWLDSQDIGGVEKTILRSCPVWLLGVQRETNEIKRTLENIPRSVAKPKPEDIATLEIGQFYACWGKHTVKTYVQPTWMNSTDAVAIATGGIAVADAVSLPRRSTKEPTVKESEARALRETNARLERENGDLLRRLESLENREFRPRAVAPTAPATVVVTAASSVPPSTAPNSEKFERIYQAIKRRLIAELPSDRAVMRIVTSRPELIVEVERKIVTIDETSVKGRVAKLLAGGFFRSAQGQGDTRTELRRTGPDVNTGSLSKVFAELLSDGFLVKHGATKYVEVPGMNARIVER